MPQVVVRQAYPVAMVALEQVVAQVPLPVWLVQKSLEPLAVQVQQE
ncbi:MAG: hypothetical protein WCE52_21985 [Candidatus Acidiferrum sp.]